MTASQPPHPMDQGIRPPAKSGMSLGCKIVLGIVLFFVTCVVIFIIMIVNAVNWFKNAPEPQPAAYTSTPLTAEQRVELFKIDTAHRKAYAEKKDWEVSFTPELFNAFLAEQIKEKKNKNEKEIGRAHV